MSSNTYIENVAGFRPRAPDGPLDLQRGARPRDDESGRVEPLPARRH